MSGRHTRNLSNLTLEQKVGSRVSDRMVPVRQAMGKDRHGVMQAREVYVDMRSRVGPDGNEKVLHGGVGGWSDSPPDLPSGDPGKQACYQPPSALYRQQYDKINWEQ
jgi:hypothetical protein